MFKINNQNRKKGKQPIMGIRFSRPTSDGLLEFLSRHPRLALALEVIGVISIVGLFLTRFISQILDSLNSSGNTALPVHLLGVFTGLVVIGSILFALIAVFMHRTSTITNPTDKNIQELEEKDGNNN